MMRFLVGVDGSDAALRAVREVAALARRGIRMEILLCCVEPPVLSGEIGVFAPIENAYLKRRAAAQAALASAEAVVTEFGLGATLHSVSGDAAVELARLADERNCDVVAVGRRGMGRIASAVLGEVSACLARTSNVPVMVVA